jgi:hypothetical protein
MATPADDPNVTLTIRLIMQGKVSNESFTVSYITLYIILSLYYHLIPFLCTHKLDGNHH